MPDLVSNSSLNFGFINNSVTNAIRSQEGQLRALITSMGSNPTVTDLLAMQQQVSSWTMMIQLQSSIVKEMSEAMKGVIQKSG
jgi:type III secretion protein F